MNKFVLLTSSALLSVASVNAGALSLSSSAFNNTGHLPYKYGYCQPNGKGGVTASDDISPQLQWADAPKETQSFVLIMTDPYIPNVANFDLPGEKNQITSDAPRVTGYHWVVVNIAKQKTGLPEGAGSTGFTIGGKAPGETAYGLMGINVYNDVFQAPIASRIEFDKSDDANYKGTYGRYDGPCAPWNDQVVHNYTFTLYALDIAQLDVASNGQFTGPDAIKAMQGHVLAKAVLVGKFVTNPDLMQNK